jgi:hypothetical protein
VETHPWPDDRACNQGDYRTRAAALFAPRARLLVYAVTATTSYTRSMRRTTLVVDDRKLARVRRILGTKGIKDTIERALDEVLAFEARRRAVEQLKTLDGLELDDPDVMADAWR